MNQRQAHIFTAIRRERAYQNAKWGSPEAHPHELPGWLLVMRKELEEAENAWVKNPSDDEVLREILQVISVGVAALEQHGVVERPETKFQNWADVSEGDDR